MATLHPSAADGFAAGVVPYETGRPDFPPQIAHWLRGTLGLGTASVVVDLGAGTGKFTPRLIETNAAVIAVEPVAAMRARLAARWPAVRTLAGAAETIPLPDASADAVVCAQSFHWFANAAALAEIARILRPGGMLGLVWNVRDETIAWVAALTDIIAPYEADTPRYRTGAWAELFPTPGFGPLAKQVFRHAHVGPVEAVIVDRVLSISFIAALPDSVRTQVAAEVRALVAATPDLAGTSDVAFPYQTVAFSCRRV